MFSTDFIFRQQDIFVDNQKCQIQAAMQQNSISIPFIFTRYFLKFNITTLDITSTHLPRNGESLLLETMKINL